MKNNKTNDPIFGHLDSLGDLFVYLQLVAVVSAFGRRRYLAETPGLVHVEGLPGCVRDNAAVFGKPHTAILRDVQPRCTNGVLAGFKIIRSAYWMKQGKLPVYAFDLHRHASFLAYTVNYDQLHVLESLEVPND